MKNSQNSAIFFQFRAACAACLRKVEEVNVFQARLDGPEAVAWIGFGEDANFVQASHQVS